MKIRKQEDISKINLLPGDTLVVSFKAADGTTTELVRDGIDNAMVVDRITVVDLDNEYGFKRGLGALFGERQ